MRLKKISLVLLTAFVSMASCASSTSPEADMGANNNNDPSYVSGRPNSFKNDDAFLDLSLIHI